MSNQKSKQNLSNSAKTNAPRANSRRIPIQNNESNADELLQNKLSKLAELQNGIEILKDRMTQTKSDLINYFDQNPQLKPPKYSVGKYYVRYLDKKQTDGLSQKLIIRGLSEYFQNNQVDNVEQEVSRALATILSVRGNKIISTVEISKDRSMKSNDDEND